MQAELRQVTGMSEKVYKTVTYDLWFGDSGTNRMEVRWQMLRFPLGDAG